LKGSAVVTGKAKTEESSTESSDYDNDDDDDDADRLVGKLRDIGL